MVRTKFAAVLIGLYGVGVLSSFTAIQGIAGAAASLGIQSSAVRDIAALVAKNDLEEVARAIKSVRRVSCLTGCFGMVIVAIMSSTVSLWTFGSTKYQWDICALGIVILLSNLQGGQMVVLQSMRRIKDLAIMQLCGSLVGTLITIGCYFWLGVRGIVPALVVTGGFQLLISWWIAKKIELPIVRIGWMESLCLVGGMLNLGLAIMGSGLLGSVVTYATNVIILQ